MRGPVDPESRRRLLRMAWQGTGAAIALAAMPGLATAGPRPRLGRDPFTLGVAAGDPDPQGAVLWTRLAPDPLNGGGMPSRAVPVRWFVAEDPGMRRLVQRGVAAAVPELAHSVHVEVNGLRPGRDYYYRFACDGDEESAVGHFRTARCRTRSCSSCGWPCAPARPGTVATIRCCAISHRAMSTSCCMPATTCTSTARCRTRVAARWTRRASVARP
jgi:phosphodiesterase/alkaline phosphatase D-like protein